MERQRCRSFPGAAEIQAEEYSRRFWSCKAWVEEHVQPQME